MERDGTLAVELTAARSATPPFGASTATSTTRWSPALTGPRLGTALPAPGG